MTSPPPNYLRGATAARFSVTWPRSFRMTARRALCLSDSIPSLPPPDFFLISFSRPQFVLLFKNRLALSIFLTTADCSGCCYPTTVKNSPRETPPPCDLLFACDDSTLASLVGLRPALMPVPGCAGEEEEAWRPETIKSSQANAGLMRAGSQVRARGSPESSAVNWRGSLHCWEIFFATRIFSIFFPWHLFDYVSVKEWDVGSLFWDSNQRKGSELRHSRSRNCVYLIHNTKTQMYKCKGLLIVRLLVFFILYFNYFLRLADLEKRCRVFN